MHSFAIHQQCERARAQLARRHSRGVIRTGADAPAPECEERLLRQWQQRRSSTAPWDWLKIAPRQALCLPICNDRCVGCWKNKKEKNFVRVGSVSEVIYDILLFKLRICRTCLRRNATAYALIAPAKPGKDKVFIPYRHLPIPSLCFCLLW